MTGTRNPTAHQRRSDLLERVETASAALSNAPAPAEAAAAIVAECLEVMNADAGFVATLTEDGRMVDVTRVTRFSKSPARLAFSLDSPYPLAQTIRTREPLFIPCNDRLACDHPGLVRIKTEDHACATLPLVAEDGTLLGALNLGFEEPHEFGADERRLIELLGEHCARAMSRLGS